MSDKKPNGEKTWPDNSKLDLQQDLQIEQDDLVIFGEDGKFYVVQKGQYTSTELPQALLSAPEFVVGLGAMVSDITVTHPWSEQSELTERCSCVVLNLAAIRQVSEKEDPRKALTFLEKQGQGDKKSTHCLHSDGKQTALNVKPGQSDLVIFNEEKKFYWVKREEYELIELPEDLRSAPEFMVRLGAVVADIPSLPTAGCACYLLNLASVRKGSSYAARVAEEQNLGGRLKKLEKQDPDSASLTQARQEAVRASKEEEEKAGYETTALRGKIQKMEADAWRKKCEAARERSKANRRGPTWMQRLRARLGRRSKLRSR
ncbi:hypothetical protein [Hyalangium versicolor]|uniref:hypothetical protein n=1 Tax=Hyalangium versicolor TaxID=2861190 RepID=UPI001CCF6376|nr:hypothetical protein [Hyalangium versicolor]